MQAPLHFYEFLNVPVQLWTESALTDWASRAARSTHCHTIANVNLHSLHLAQKRGPLRECLCTADAVHIDGMPVIALCRMLGIPARREHRVTYIDWLRRLFEVAAQEHLRVFFLGSKPGVGERAGDILRRRYAGLLFESHHGYFDAAPDAQDNLGVLEHIHRFDADLLLVGMGMPRQEQWILENRERLPGGVCLPCGAALDYVAGVVPKPPRWTGRLGVEWLFRLLVEPRRLAHRYLIEPWSLGKPFASALFRHWIRRR